MKEELKRLFTGYWNYLAISAACKVKLFDVIAQGDRTIEEIAIPQELNPVALEALINVCISEELIIKNEGILSLTGKGKYLVSTHPENMYHACLHWSAEHLNAWQEMTYTVQTGKSSFEMIYKEPFFDYIGKRPEKLDAYHKAMFAYALDDYAHIADHLPLQGVRSVLDVGGGYGALISQVKKDFPDIRCALFDLPEVTANVNIDGVEAIAGNFFKSITAGFDCIIMSRVLHDWNDEASRKILLNAMEALNNDGKLVLIENLSDKMKDKASALTLNMLAICNSYERTEAEYIRLITGAGFRFGSSTRLNSLQYILTAIKP